MIICACGCGESPKYPGAKFVHGHHLRLREFQRKPQKRNPLTCAHCSNPFYPKKRGTYLRAKFCSRQCSAMARCIHGRNCKNCGKYFIPSNGRSINCSLVCRIEYQIKRGRPGSYRQNAFKSFERRCYDCGYDIHPEIILIHHINGDRGNGALSNLIPLCQNCHCLRHIQMSGNAKIPSSRRHKP